MNAIFTIGYEGTDIASFVHALGAAGVRVVADVRELPLSRKAGFSKTPLRRLLESKGFAYLHFRALGDPKPGRQAAKAGEYHRFRDIYSRHLKSENAQTALKELARIAKKDATCLMCFERDPIECHRTIIVNAMVGFTPQNLFASVHREQHRAFSRSRARQGSASAQQDLW